MDLSNISAEKRALLTRIKEAEARGDWQAQIEDDPPTKPLLAEEADYLCEKPSNRLKRRIANRIADKYFLKLIKKGVLIVDGVQGEEYLSVLRTGAILTCNHFSPMDNYILYHSVRKALPKKYLYKVIKEGNYTNFSGLYGFFFRHCHTLPLSQNRRTMVAFTKAVHTLLQRGESILIYPEQEMWWNYRKPRPFMAGAFKLAYREDVPVLPVFITMQDDGEKVDKDGYPLQRHTVHILPPVYPDRGLGEKLGAQAMQEAVYERYVATYEEAYRTKLVYERVAEAK